MHLSKIIKATYNLCLRLTTSIHVKVNIRKMGKLRDERETRKNNSTACASATPQATAEGPTSPGTPHRTDLPVKATITLQPS